MNHATQDTNDTHAQTQTLLPWLINQTLHAEEQQQVEEHLRHCLVCRRELIDLQKMAEHLTAPSDLEAAAEASFAGIVRKLPERNVSAKPLYTTKAAPKRSWPRINRTPSWLALAASLLLFVPVVWHGLPPLESTNYTTLSSTQPKTVTGRQLKVVFSPSLSNSEVAAILAQIHGQKLDEPNSMGAYTIKLEEDNGSATLDQTLALLRQRPDVLFAEPVTQP